MNNSINPKKHLDPEKHAMSRFAHYQLNRRHALFTGLAGALYTMTGCVQRELTSGQTTIPPHIPHDQLRGHSITVGDQEGETRALLTSSGELTHLPYTVHFSNFVSGPPEVEAANANAIDFAIMGVTPPIFAAAAHARLRIIAQYTNPSAGLGEAIYVPNSSTISTIPDLAGKRVAVTRATSAHGHLLSQLAAHHMQPTDISLMYLSPAEASIALAQRTIDAWAIWDPYSAQLETEKKYRSIANATMINIPTSNYAIASVAALNDPIKNSILSDFIVRYAYAATWAHNHPQAWISQYSALTGFSLETSRISQTRSLRYAQPITSANIIQLQNLAHTFAQAGQIPEPLLHDYTDTRYNPIIQAHKTHLYHAFY